ncbi:unnamed protein product, partial [Dracunculus medinensis]|uniref:Sulfate_transp domain-containing protein n=1 Tax=Dracunculus medinensis TaxID=318479 RepID=A0A0N4U610_DRAME
EEFDAKFSYKPPIGIHSKRRILKKFLRNYYHPCLSFRDFRDTLISFFPIIQWLPNYTIKRDLIFDLIGGLTVGVMHIPQGIAYAALAQLHPVVGLYVSFFPAIFYVIFGTSRHNSLEDIANSINGRSSYVKNIDDNDVSTTSVTNMEIACVLTITVGFIHVLMAVLRLQFIATYFSDQVVGGFTTAASIHVLVSQLNSAIGISGLPRRSGYGQLILRLYDIFIHIQETNLYVVGITVISMVFLYTGKEIITPLVKKWTKLLIPIPFELILVITATVLSELFDFKHRFNLGVVGKIPIG